MYTYQRKIASSNSYSEYQKQADLSFWEAVAKKVNSKQRYAKATTKNGVSVSFLEFEGVDVSDISLSGHASLILVDSNTVKVFVKYDSGWKGQDEKTHTFKSGVLTTDLASDLILEVIGV